MPKCLMTKPLSKCIAITIVFIFVTLSSAHEGLKLCRRIKSNSLKLSAMGPLGATDFVLLTSEGHLFIVPKRNLLNVGQPSMNLYLDRVPINPERLFGVQLNYTQQEYRYFFILYQQESNSTLLVTTEQNKTSVKFKSIFRTFNFEWNRNSEDTRAQVWEEELFYPAFVMNGYMDQCATVYFYDTKISEYDLTANYAACWHGRNLSIGDNIDQTTIVSSRIGPFSAQVPIQTGFELPLDGIFHRFALLDSGEIYYTRDGTPNPSHLCLLKDFIQCGPGFRDETDRWIEPTTKEPKEVDSEKPNNVSTEATQPNDGQPSNIIWILLVVAVLVLVASLFCWLCRKKKMKRISKNRAGSSAKDTSSNKVSSPNSSIDTGPTSSKATSSQAPKPKKKKTSGQVKSVKDRIWSILKGGRKKAAKSRANANKSKANKSKANKSSRT